MFYQRRPCLKHFGMAWGAPRGRIGVVPGPLPGREGGGRGLCGEVRGGRPQGGWVFERTRERAACGTRCPSRAFAGRVVRVGGRSPGAPDPERL